VQSSSQIVTINKPTPSFVQADTCAVAQPTVLEQESITFPGLAHLKLIWVLPTLSFTAKGSWLPWGGLPSFL